MTARPAAPGSDLTATELKVLRLAAAGMSNRQIAFRLNNASTTTVEYYVKRLSQRLGVTGKTNAVAAAVRLGLVTIPVYGANKLGSGAKW